MGTFKSLAGFMVLFISLAAANSATAATIAAPFASSYSFVDLGAASTVPSFYGGLVFKNTDSNTLLLGGSANSPSGVIDAISVVRGAGSHVTGFTGSPTLFATAGGNPSGGIDGGLTYAPNGTLLFTSYPDNSLGQIKPGSSAPDKRVALTALGITSSVGAITIVPAGIAGAGHAKILSWSGGIWYDATLTPDGSGTYNVNNVGAPITLNGGPEGTIYIKGGNPQFAQDSVLIDYWGLGEIDAYAVDANGDPIVATRRPFITGLSGAEGAAIDPVTGDFFFSTFGGGDRVIEVTGFLAPEATTLSVLGLIFVGMMARRRAKWRQQ